MIVEKRGSMSRETSTDRDDRKLVVSSEEGLIVHAAPAASSQSSSSASSSNRAPPRRIDHTYRDYSNFPTADLPVLKAPTNFPSKLHHILSDPEYQHAISWMPHGRAWKIHNKDLLVSEVVPKYFIQSKYQSFARQLNGWGFKRLQQAGNDFNAYYHECFLRGMPQLAVLMKRVTPNQGRLLPHVEGEPNFYEIDTHFRLPPAMGYPQGGHHQYYHPQTAQDGSGGHGDYHQDQQYMYHQGGGYPPQYYGHSYYNPNNNPNMDNAAAAANPQQQQAMAVAYPGYPPYYQPMAYGGPPPPGQFPQYGRPPPPGQFPQYGGAAPHYGYGEIVPPGPSNHGARIDDTSLAHASGTPPPSLQVEQSKNQNPSI